MTRNLLVVASLCLIFISTACSSLRDRCPPPIPSKPEVIKVSEPQETPCPRTYPAFVVPPGATSDDIDKAHQRYIREELLPIIACFVKGTVAPGESRPE